MATFVFGPVPSRRLGRSLGVDVVPFKTCTYDCIYCQLGRTAHKTTRRASFAKVTDVVDELKETLGRVPRPDYITISGSGEPTLYSDLADLVAGIREITATPVALLTNGSLFFRKDVRQGCCRADVVLPSLDAGDESMFRYVNRPHRSLSFDEMVEGLIDFRAEFDKEIWLEVFLLAGVNATPAEVMKIKEHIGRIKPDRIQLNTVVRPPAREFAYAVGQEELTELCALFGERAEVIRPFLHRGGTEVCEMRREEILSLLARRPCSLEDLADGLMLNKNGLLKDLNDLVSSGLVRYVYRKGQVYYMKANG